MSPEHKLRICRPGKPADVFRLKLGARRLPEERSTPDACFERFTRPIWPLTCNKRIPSVAKGEEGLALRAQSADTGHHRVTCLRDGIGSIVFSRYDKMKPVPSAQRAAHKFKSQFPYIQSSPSDASFVALAGELAPSSSHRGSRHQHLDNRQQHLHSSTEAGKRRDTNRTRPAAEEKVPGNVLKNFYELLDEWPNARSVDAACIGSCFGSNWPATLRKKHFVRRGLFQDQEKGGCVLCALLPRKPRGEATKPLHTLDTQLNSETRTVTRRVFFLSTTEHTRAKIFAERHTQASLRESPACRCGERLGPNLRYNPTRPNRYQTAGAAVEERSEGSDEYAVYITPTPNSLFKVLSQI
ncbi:hypothetical protein C8R45DRAFT_923945 [Mycena sanguinolenta]|nr:hypothetical protein C8R45DRAFT_923945 [Mycena sanguinolenta]